MFRSVPRNEAISAIEEMLKADRNFTRKTVYLTKFQFRNEHYELSDGLAMSAPSSPVIANIYMVQLEKKALRTFGTPPKLWRRYVDDVLAIKKKYLLSSLLVHLNGQYPAIRFTSETEDHGHLPFLDTDVRRVEERLITTVYR